MIQERLYRAQAMEQDKQHEKGCLHKKKKKKKQSQMNCMITA